MTSPIDDPLDPLEIAAEHENLQRAVAVLIMAVTLIGAVFAFLQTQAGNRESHAAREAQASSVQATAEVIEGRRAISRNSLAWELKNDNGWLAIYYREVGGPAAPYAEALAKVHEEVEAELEQYSVVEQGDTYKLEDETIDWGRFYEDQYRDSYRAAELEKAHGIERDDWSDKGDQYVAVITILAVALFLLGLSLTVPGAARRLFVVTGIVVAVVGTAWGVLIWSRPVAQPDLEAIDAYVEGLVLINSGDSEEDFRASVDRLSEAIEADPEYIDAYVTRGNAYFELDFLNPDGPQGSQEAVTDFRRAIDLGLDDYISWGNLGAAQWWLGQYDDALQATERAFLDKPDDLIVSLNYAESLLLRDGLDGDSYLKQLDHIRDLLEKAPQWQRNFTMDSFYEASDLSLKYRPELAEENRQYRDALLRMHHEIDVSNELYGTPDPEPVAATMTDPEFTLSPNRRKLRAVFDYEGVEEGQKWLYHTYIDGVREDAYSIEEEEWSFEVPDGGVVLTFTDGDRFDHGSEVRTEVFLEGNLLAAGEYTIP